MYKNHVSLIGFLGQDAQTKHTTNGEPCTVLRLATQESWKDQTTGEWVRRTEWHRIVCWGKLARWVADLQRGHIWPSRAACAPTGSRPKSRRPRGRRDPRRNSPALGGACQLRAET